MSIDQPVSGIDLSDGVARVISLEVSSMGVLVSAIGMTEPTPFKDLGEVIQPEDLRISTELLCALKRMWSDIGISSCMVAVAVPSQATLLRRLVVPKVESSHVREVVTYEIARTVAADDVAIDFQVYRELSHERVEVDVVVVKSAHVQSLLDKVSSVGLLPVAVDVAAYALQTAYHFAYREEFRRCVLIIYLGRRCATCLISRSGELCWVGSFPLSAEVEGEIERIIVKVAEEVQSAQSFGGAPLSIDKVLIGGFVPDGARVTESVRAVLGGECHEFDPLRQVPNLEEFRRSQPTKLSVFALSFGLALRHQLTNYRGSNEQFGRQYAL